MFKALILFSVCNRNVKVISNFFNVQEMVVHNWLFKVSEFIFFQQFANTYSFSYVIVTIGIGVKSHLITISFAKKRNQLFSFARYSGIMNVFCPGILVPNLN